MLKMRFWNLSGFIWISKNNPERIKFKAETDLINNSRLYAEKHNTTLNNLVREYLKHLTNNYSAYYQSYEY